MMRLLDGEEVDRPPFAPPFLRAGPLLIGQTANILLYLGARHRLAPMAEAGRLWTHQLQLTMADFVDEIHDTHHPIAGSLYYEDQKPQARARGRRFRANRACRNISAISSGCCRATRPATAISSARGCPMPICRCSRSSPGCATRFRGRWRRSKPNYPRVAALHDRVAARPRIAAYLTSSRRIAFNQHGIFRHYPELDQATR